MKSVLNKNYSSQIDIKLHPKIKQKSYEAIVMSSIVILFYFFIFLFSIFLFFIVGQGNKKTSANVRIMSPANPILVGKVKDVTPETPETSISEDEESGERWPNCEAERQVGAGAHKDLYTKYGEQYVQRKVYGGR